MLGVTACANTSRPAPDSAYNTAEIARVAERARSLPKAVEATGHYETGITGYGRTTLSVRVSDPPTEVPAQKALLDEMERLVWHSGVTPITVLRLHVYSGVQPFDGSPAFARVYEHRGLVDRIADRLGPRPTQR